MSDDEQKLVIGQMVLDRKQLKVREAVLFYELARTSKELKRLSELLSYYLRSPSVEIKIEPEVARLLDAEKITALVSDHRANRQELSELEGRLSSIE